MANRTPPIAAMLISSSLIQNDRGRPWSHAMVVVMDPTRTMPKETIEPTATASAMRVRSGTLANRQPRLYSPSRPFETSRTRTTSAGTSISLPTLSRPRISSEPMDSAM